LLIRGIDYWNIVSVLVLLLIEQNFGNVQLYSWSAWLEYFASFGMVKDPRIVCVQPMTCIMLPLRSRSKLPLSVLDVGIKDDIMYFSWTNIIKELHLAIVGLYMACCIVF
jgi:hypothetical protein